MSAPVIVKLRNGYRARFTSEAYRNLTDRRVETPGRMSEWSNRVAARDGVGQH